MEFAVNKPSVVTVSDNKEAPVLEISGALFKSVDPYACVDFCLPSSRNPTLVITHDKKVIWNGREVNTDEELVNALRKVLTEIGKVV